MRLSNPTAIKFSALALSGIVRGWMSTLDFRIRLDHPLSDPLCSETRNIYVFWHETLLFPAYTHARLGVAVLVSQHRDGELIAQVLRMMRGSSVRGSTTRGSVPALRQMMAVAKVRHLAITPDGPKGPRRTMQSGAIFLASKTGMPIVPCGFAFHRPWRLPSWDRMMIPRPLSAGRAVMGMPIHVPGDLSREDLDDCCRQVQMKLDSAQAQAELAAQRLAVDESFLPLNVALGRAI